MAVEGNAKGDQRGAGEQGQAVLPQRVADEDRGNALGFRGVGFVRLHEISRYDSDGPA